MTDYLQPPFSSLWRQQDVFQAVEALQGDVYREVKDRRTLRTEVDGKGYFVKIHRGVGWAEIIKNVVSLRLPVLGAKNEFLAIQRLQEIGVQTMTAVAFAERGKNPAKRHSFIITEELAPTISLEDYCAHWANERPNWREKRALIKRVAGMVRQMHQAGINHRDCYICHFLLDTSKTFDPENFKLSIIDLHRAQIRAKTPRRWRDKDLAALYYSSLEIGLTKMDKIYFLQVYFGSSLRDIIKQEQVLLRYLERKVLALYLRQLRYGGKL